MEAGAGGHGAKLRAKDVTIHYWLERQNSAFLAVDRVNLDVNEGPAPPFPPAVPPVPPAPPDAALVPLNVLA